MTTLYRGDLKEKHWYTGTTLLLLLQTLNLSLSHSYSYNNTRLRKRCPIPVPAGHFAWDTGTHAPHTEARIPKHLVILLFFRCKHTVFSLQQKSGCNLAAISLFSCCIFAAQLLYLSLRRTCFFVALEILPFWSPWDVQANQFL